MQQAALRLLAKLNAELNQLESNALLRLSPPEAEYLDLASAQELEQCHRQLAELRAEILFITYHME